MTVLLSLVANTRDEKHNHRAPAKNDFHYRTAQFFPMLLNTPRSQATPGNDS